MVLQEGKRRHGSWRPQKVPGSQTDLAVCNMAQRPGAPFSDPGSGMSALRSHCLQECGKYRIKPRQGHREQWALMTMAREPTLSWRNGTGAASVPPRETHHPLDLNRHQHDNFSPFQKFEHMRSFRINSRLAFSFHLVLLLVVWGATPRTAGVYPYSSAGGGGALPGGAQGTMKCRELNLGLQYAKRMVQPFEPSLLHLGASACTASCRLFLPAVTGVLYSPALRMHCSMADGYEVASG